VTPDDIYDEVTNGFSNRKYAAGLAVAFIDFLRELGLPRSSIRNFDDFLTAFPRREFRSAGKPANTLIVDLPGGQTLSLRPAYNAIDRFFRATHKRFDYPSCPGHATAQWQTYRNWLDAMCGFDLDELESLRIRICDFVLESLPSQAFDPNLVDLEPPLFSVLLEEFDFTKHAGEKTGAAYQGAVFGFLRADNPHLQVEIDKVRTGSKRLQRIGDIDAWEGGRLAITAEVKQYHIKNEDIDDFSAFANDASKRGAIGIVCGLGLEDGVKDKFDELGLHALDLEDLREIVALWDPMKQRTAIASMTYYVEHVEKNSALAGRLRHFIIDTVASFENPDRD